MYLKLQLIITIGNSTIPSKSTGNFLTGKVTTLKVQELPVIWLIVTYFKAFSFIFIVTMKLNVSEGH